ncbi:hypothetical protein POM88_023920 [Heracleum sosnowskyi]|uniref:Pentatricopeptide repeat-containing protein n=1 Tax=Heracleum sosnowskyi TaxID=360622 RepID=A0AAD8ILM2_9APIA|nr:hypothetical protein POM88_023920 [Heracleum sosnowskyi]
MIEKGILPNVKTYPPLIQVLCHFNRWEEVGLLLNEMMEDLYISPNVRTFNILVDAYSKSGKLDDAKHLIEIMKERGEEGQLFTILMHAYCSQGQLDGALAVLNSIESKKMKPNCYTYSILQLHKFEL